MSGHYNGFTPSQRASGGAAYNEAIRLGRVDAPSVCEACGATDDVAGHNEDYRTPLEFFDVCFVCHMMIHCRYHDVSRWQQYLALLDEGAVMRRVRGWSAFRAAYLNSALDALVIGRVEPRGQSFLPALPTVWTGAPPAPMPRPARLGGGYRGEVG